MDCRKLMLMPLAIQEHLLSGATLDEKLQNARAMGVTGIEFAADGLTARVPEVSAALERSGLRAAAVDAGFTRLVHPDFAERDLAIARLRQAMADSLDLGAGGVVFIPHFQTEPILPDLRPYKSAVELEAEMLVKQLRATLSDLAYAMGAELYLLPVSRNTAHLINLLSQGARVRKGLDDHPHVMLAVDLDHLMMEEADAPQSIHDHADAIRYVRHSSASPAASLSALTDVGYNGWMTRTNSF